MKFVIIKKLYVAGCTVCAGVAKLADALDLGSSSERSAGSIPVTCIFIISIYDKRLCYSEPFTFIFLQLFAEKITFQNPRCQYCLLHNKPGFLPALCRLRCFQVPDRHVLHSITSLLSQLHLQRKLQYLKTG